MKRILNTLLGAGITTIVTVIIMLVMIRFVFVYPQRVYNAWAEKVSAERDLLASLALLVLYFIMGICLPKNRNNKTH